MNIKEKRPLPLRCLFCKEVKKAAAACGDCDYALNRFELLDDEGNKIEI